MGARAQAVLFASTLALGAACGSSDAQPDADLRCVDLDGPASLEIGGGAAQTGFFEVQDGDDMPIVIGPGGLYMLGPSIRAWGVYPGDADSSDDSGDPEVFIEIFLESDRIGESTRHPVGLTVTADGAEGLAIWTPFTVEPPSTYINQAVTLHGEITDICGNTATDTLEVVVVIQ